jgi:hypothetical protein
MGRDTAVVSPVRSAATVCTDDPGERAAIDLPARSRLVQLSTLPTEAGAGDEEPPPGACPDFELDRAPLLFAPSYEADLLYGLWPSAPDHHRSRSSPPAGLLPNVPVLPVGKSFLSFAGTGCSATVLARAEKDTAAARTSRRGRGTPCHRDRV